MSHEVDIAITHPRLTSQRPRTAHVASLRSALDEWRSAVEGRSFEIGPSIGNSWATRLAFSGEDDPGSALRELDVGLNRAELTRTMTDYARDRSRTSTDIVTRLQWHDWITRDLSPTRGKR